MYDYNTTNAQLFPSDYNRNFKEMGQGNEGVRLCSDLKTES